MNIKTLLTETENLALHAEIADLLVRLEALGAGGVSTLIPPKQCNHEFYRFGDQKERRCNWCSFNESQAATANPPVALPAWMPEPVARASKGPDGFASWKDAAIAARISASPAVVDQPPVAVVDEDEDGLFADFETEIGVVVKRGDKLYAAPQPQQIAEPADKQGEVSSADVVRGLRQALRRIAAWELPQAQDREGNPSSYTAEYGSNGAREYFRAVAADALKETP